MLDLLGSLTYIGYFLLGTNFILFLLGLKKFVSRSYFIFTFYLSIIIIIQFFTAFFKRNGINNLFLSHLYFVFQFIILSFFYLSILKNKKQKKIVKYSLLLCPLILVIQYIFNPELFLRFNLLEIFLTSFLLIIFSMFHFYNILNEKRTYYYINMGILIYLFGSTVVFLSGNIISVLNFSTSKIIWELNSVLYVIYQILIMVEWFNIRIKKM
ncbi:hypothetical protein DI487_02190 [Flavobacterium sediminis]|uniref:YhhN-like protein n=2 Tax=Flavobacterium TaxID=237 RepID=A0A2U8QSE5_9FLAO|nr:hypothetical protein DI487_02190 [Flavobacterium sediminis]